MNKDLLQSLFGNLGTHFCEDAKLNEFLSCGICDNCSVPKMRNSGDGINEPLDPYLYCDKMKREVSPEPENEQLKECEFFKQR